MNNLSDLHLRVCARLFLTLFGTTWSATIGREREIGDIIKLHLNESRFIRFSFPFELLLGARV